MTIHFFLGSEFSSDTDFEALTKGAEIACKNSRKEDHQSIQFYSCGTNISEVVKSYKVGDVIIGASAGGRKAAELYQEIILKKISEKPTLIGFEAYGMEDIQDAITIVQAENPRGFM